MEKCFNIAGPCFPDEHYMFPALERLPGIMRIVEQRSYFVLHAARQSGKTTALMALVGEINQKGTMNALYFTVESVQMFTDPNEGIPRIVERMRSALANHQVFKTFAVSIALVGMRDIRGYKARIRPDGQTLGSASPFNIITEDLTLGNFKEEDVKCLYAQHTEPITVGDVIAAKEKIIRKNPMHLDYLFYMMRHPKVATLFKAILDGSFSEDDRQSEGFMFIRDIGIFLGKGSVFEFANQIYAEYCNRINCSQIANVHK